MTIGNHQYGDAASALRSLVDAGDRRRAELPLELWLLGSDDLGAIYGITSARARALCAAGAITGAFKSQGKWVVRAVDVIAAWEAAKSVVDVGDDDGRLDGWEGIVPRKRRESP